MNALQRAARSWLATKSRSCSANQHRRTENKRSFGCSTGEPTRSGQTGKPSRSFLKVRVELSWPLPPVGCVRSRTLWRRELDISSNLRGKEILLALLNMIKPLFVSFCFRFELPRGADIRYEVIAHSSGILLYETRNTPPLELKWMTSGSVSASSYIAALSPFKMRLEKDGTLGADVRAVTAEEVKDELPLDLARPLTQLTFRKA